MKKFWSYIKNDKYAVGCSGQTTYVYDNAGVELAKFKKDIIYAYVPVFCPNKDIFIVKSTDGRIAVYSLAELKLIKKFRFSKVDYSQDDGLCFSGDGRYLYNIERHIDSLHSRISVYDTEEFNLVKRLFEDEKRDILFEYIEYDKEKDGIYVCGFFPGTYRNKNNRNVYFAAELKDDVLADITELETEDKCNLYEYKSLELNGFTEKAREYSSLDDKVIKELQDRDIHISDYIKKQE